MKPQTVAVVASVIFSTITVAHAAVEISSQSTSNMTCSGGVCSPTAKKAVLNVSDLAGMLASGDVTVSSGALAKDIEVDAALSWASSQRLTLDSYRAITFNKPVEVTGTGALTITTNGGGRAGDFRFSGKGRVRFWDLRSALSINGNDYTLEKSLKELASDIRHDGNGFYALAKSINEKGHVRFQSPIERGFSGTFEGLGNVISNLTINDSTNDEVGLFPHVAIFSAMIRDVGLTSANITGIGSSVGSLVGTISDGTVLNSYANGQVTGHGSNSFVGGLTGSSVGATIEYSHSDVVAVSDNGAAGGLVGYIFGDCGTDGCFGMIKNSYATGSINGGDGTMVGGLVGYSFGGVIANSYATGTTSGGNSALVGGLVGASTDNTADQTPPFVSDSYSIDLVSGGSSATVGGLIGQDAADAQNTNNYWDTDTSGVSDPSKGAGNIANDPGITGLTDTQLKSALPSGFDKEVWKQKPDINSGYPYLIDNPPQN